MVENQIHLILFFTRGMSLQAWDAIGMFEREVALYLRLQQLGVCVSFVTYGDVRELQYAQRLKGINILCNRWNLAPHLYEKLLPILHARSLLRAQVFKSNQINGADVALCAARFWGKKCIARGGYLYSLNTERKYGSQADITQQAINLEKKVFNQADAIIVTTLFMREYIAGRYDISNKNVRIIPNYVDVDLFKPWFDEQILTTQSLCFIGRLEKEKNIAALLDALKGLDVKLEIIGGGFLDGELRQKAAQDGIPAQFLGNLAHTALPKHIQRAALYVQPSLYEGHPKTILEAMACGKVVLGGDSPGIREVIQHGVNGWLCGTSAEEIRQAILTLLGDAALRRKLGENARAYVLQHCSLAHVAEMELALYREVLHNGY